MALWRRRASRQPEVDLTEVITDSPALTSAVSPNDPFRGINVDRDLWPQILPPSASSSPTRSRTDWTLNLGPQPPSPIAPPSPRRVRGVRTTTSAVVRASDETSSESNDETNFLARKPWARGGRTASAPMLTRPSPGSDATFGGGQSDAPSGNTCVSPGSQPASPVSSSEPSPRGIGSRLSAPSNLGQGRLSPSYRPADWQYQVAEKLFLAGTGSVSASNSSYRDATFGSHRTSPAPSRLSRLGRGRSSSVNSVSHPRHSDSSAPRRSNSITPFSNHDSSNGTRSVSDAHSPTSPAHGAAVRRLKSMPSLIEPSASDEESESSEASWQDAAEEFEADVSLDTALPGPGPPTVRLVRIRLSTDAAIVYDHERRSQRTSNASTVKVPFFDRTSIFFQRSPPLSPSRRLSSYSQRSTPRDEPSPSGDESTSFFEPEDSYVDLPMPPEPLRSKHVYQPTLSANFLSAPPSKLRRQFLREQRRRARTKSLPARPPSLIGPYLHPPPERPHSSSDLVDSARSTYLEHDLRGPTTRLSTPAHQQPGYSLWSVSTRPDGLPGQRTAHSSDETTTESSGLPTTQLGRLLYAIRCVPPAAWLFLFGFVCPPLWWLGSCYPLLSRTGQREYWGSARRSPLLESATLPRCSPSSPPAAVATTSVSPRSEAEKRRSGFRARHDGLLPPEEAAASATRLPGPKRLSDFLNEVPARGWAEESEATFWAAQRSIWRWRLRCRVMTLLSGIVLIPIIVFAALSKS